MNEELTLPEGPRKGRKPSQIAKRDNLNTLIAKIRDSKGRVDKNSQSK